MVSASHTSHGTLYSRDMKKACLQAELWLMYMLAWVSAVTRMLKGKNWIGNERA